MPTYTYHCPANGRSIDVLHGINIMLRTWGEICEADDQEPGETPSTAEVEKRMGSGMVLTNTRAELNNGPAGPPRGCCGGGCGRPG